jgi:hypothetical protein
MAISAPQPEQPGEIRTSILASIHDLAADMEYCDTLAETKPEEYRRLWAYLVRRKNDLRERIQKVPNVYLRHSLLTTFAHFLE